VRGPVRRELEGGRAVAGDDNRLPPLDLARELGQAILRLANGYSLHEIGVSLGSHSVNAGLYQTVPPVITTLSKNRLTKPENVTMMERDG
jgi:hypothetical protein